MYIYIYIYICKTPTLQRNNGQHGCFCKPTVSGATNSGRAVPGRAGHSGSKAPAMNAHNIPPPPLPNNTLTFPEV